MINEQIFEQFMKRAPVLLTFLVLAAAIRYSQVRRPSKGIDHRLGMAAFPENADRDRENLNDIFRVVFSGGGVKGVTYPGASAALQETGLLKKIKQVAGSSTGSLSAGFLAVGIDAKKFREAFIDLDLGADPLERQKQTYYQLLKKTFKTKIQTLCNISNFEIHKYLNSGYKDSWRMVF